MSVKQEEIVPKLIQDHTPEQLNLSCALWTRQSVAKVIEERFGMRMPIRTMGEYLLRWGFTPQKPLKKAYEQSPQEVNKWLKEDYPLIAQRAKTEGAEIHWGDETGLRCDDVRGRSYAPKGKTPVLRVNAKRVALSVISTVTNKGQMRWKIFHRALDVSILIDFLQRLITGMKKKVFLILDNLRVHHSKALKAWLGKYATQIEVFYLPSYSPELNPHELANADLKQGVTCRTPTRSKLQLLKAASHHLRSVQRRPERIRAYFQHLPVRYAA